MRYDTLHEDFREVCLVGVTEIFMIVREREEAAGQAVVSGECYKVFLLCLSLSTGVHSVAVKEGGAPRPVIHATQAFPSPSALHV